MKNQKPEWLLYGESLREQVGAIVPSKSGRAYDRFAQGTYHAKGYKGTLADWYFILRIRLPR